MPPDRASLLHAALTAAAIGVGVTTGNPLIATVVGGLGINWASSLTEKGIAHLSVTWSGHDGLLQPDLARAYGRAVDKALAPAQLVRAFRQLPAYQSLRERDPEAAAAAIALLTQLRDDLQPFLTQPQTALAESIRASGAALPPAEAQAARQAVHAYVGQYLDGHSEAVIRFVRDRLEPQRLAGYFAAELAADTPAWRAYQQLLFANLRAGLNQVQQAAADIAQAQAALADPARYEPGLSAALAGLASDLKRHVSSEADRVIQQVTAEVWAHTTSPRHAPLDLTAALARLAELPLKGSPPITPLPPGSRLPYAPNPHFVGRKAGLVALARALKGGQAAAVTGIGGIGKTQLAVEFAHRYGSYFAGGVYWLNCADPNLIDSELADCGGMVAAASFYHLELLERLRLVQQAMQEAAPRLLVLDNLEADDAEALFSRYRPASGGCRVLVTSRRAHWDSALGLRVVSVETLTLPESARLLRDLAPRLTQQAAEAIARELGRFPLALHQAGAYLRTYAAEVTAAAYLAELRRAPLQHPSLTGERGAGHSPTVHERHVGRTFAVSWARLRATDPLDRLAQQLLQQAAHCAPDVAIPRALLAATLNAALQMETGDDEAAHDPLDVADARRRALDLGLATAEADGAVRLHRLAAAFIRPTAGGEEAQAAVERGLANAAARLNQAGYPAPLRAWLAHLTYVTETALPRADALAARLASELGYHLDEDGSYRAALPLYERALAIHEQALGAAHPSTAASLNNLAALYRSMGGHARALPLVERALALTEQALGADHPDTAGSLNNLAAVYDSMGDYARALPLYERALAITEQALGVDHPSTATSLNNLALLYKSMGDYARALPLYARALAITEQALGAAHPSTATSLNNLALLYASMGGYARALPLHARALAIREQALGADHPDTATSLNNLAAVYASMGDYARALPLVERALAIEEQALGADHPSTATSLNNLAVLYASMGDYARALPLYERALAITEQALGADHPDTAASLNNLAAVYYSMGDYPRVLPLYERALAIREEALGADHPDTAASLNSLALLYYSMGDYPRVLPLVARALAICEQALGVDHPDTAQSLNNLALLYASMGDYARALPLYARALAIREQALGADHPDTATSLNNLALLYDTMGDYARALPLYARALAILRQRLGDEHPHTKTATANLAALRQKLAEAEDSQGGQAPQRP